jgi:uncharacterized SAM-dependent methyltransferase
MTDRDVARVLEAARAARYRAIFDESDATYHAYLNARQRARVVCGVDVATEPLPER